MRLLREVGVAILLGLTAALAYSTLRAQVLPHEGCAEGYCTIKQVDFMRLAQWASLCHWTEE